MFKKVFQVLDLKRKTLPYMLVSFLVVLLNFLVFYTLVHLGVLPEIAALVGAFLGVLAGFIGHSRFTWSSSDRTNVWVRFSKYATTYTVQIIVSLATLSAAIRIAGLSYLVAYILSAAVGTAITFLTLNFWVFKPYRDK